MEMNIIQVYYPIVYLYEHTGNHVASLSTAYEETEKKSCLRKQTIVSKKRSFYSPSITVLLITYLLWFPTQSDLIVAHWEASLQLDWEGS